MKNNLSKVTVLNPEGVFPSEETYYLANKLEIDNEISVILTDMDGTTTSTETLCLHSLNYMMKKICGFEFEFSEDDYRYIIGNSTTKHVEYLLKTYRTKINQKFLKKYAINSARWTISHGLDKNRVREALTVFKGNINSMVKQAIEIYYARYHSILEEIKKGKGIELSQDLTAGESLIKPMENVSLFLALTTNLLNSDVEKLGKSPLEKEKLKKISAAFSKKQLKVGLVTSSILYEADIILAEVFRKIREEIKEWPIKIETKKTLLKKFASYEKFYDTVVTADDSSEIRLKPHRDLYSIAIFKLGIKKEDFNTIIGFEDSTSGVISLRAAGVGKVVAVPFKQSENHDFSASSMLCKGGLTEFLFKKFPI